MNETDFIYFYISILISIIGYDSICIVLLVSM